MSGSLVLGASGQLGTAFSRLAPDATLVTRAELDLAVATGAEIRNLLAERSPSLVVNCAAYTAVDKAEEDEALATQVNGHAVGLLAQAAGKVGLPFVSYSTDYVFAGNATRPYVESDPTSPVNAYGRSKLVGEEAAFSANPNALIVRTSWVLSSTHRNFVTAILGRAVKGETLSVVNDQRGCPTVVDDLAAATLAAVEKGASGLLHLTNQGETTWFDLARTAVDMAGLDDDLVSPCPTSDYPTPAQRPAYSVLGSERVEKLGVTPLPRWVDSLESVVAGSLALLGV